MVGGNNSKKGWWPWQVGIYKVKNGNYVNNNVYLLRHKNMHGNIFQEVVCSEKCFLFFESQS